MNLTDERLKRLFVSAIGGSWGTEPGESDIDVPCIRGTDFDTVHLRVDKTHAPLRGFTLTDIRSRSAVAGDLIIEKSGGGEQQPVGRAVLWDGPGIVIPTNFAARLRVSPGTDPRFATYLLASMWSDGRTRAAIKQTTGIQNLDLSALLDQRVSRPPISIQIAVADYLDRETARIDALVTAKRRMVELLDERDRIAFERVVGSHGFVFPTDLAPDWSDASLPQGWQVMHLSQVLDQLTNGYVGPTRDILVDSGVPYIQSLHIKNGQIDFSRREFFVEQSWHDERPRIHLREGDVLIVQTGDIGQVAVVPEGFGAASCHALQIARVKRKLMTGPYLCAYLRSSFGFHSLLSRATGALHPHLEAGIKDIPVVVPPLDAQHTVVTEVERVNRETTRLRSFLNSQIDLLHERRQALVTVAITGQLHIWEVA